jgi:thiosulfate/3-mercaptopyruvate sulfurtransferase
MYTTLIDASELASHTGDANWVVLDCRFDLARPDWGASAYADGHITRAIYVNLDRDLSGPVTPASGRHPMPDMEAFVAKLGTWGVDDDVQVVAYDQNNGAYASRLWWLVRWAGHGHVAVLNGGLAAWQQAGFPLSKQPSASPPRRFFPGSRQRQGDVVSTVELQKMLVAGELTNGTRSLVDARSADRFAGQNETLDRVAGHIPGATNHPFAQNLDAQGRFLAAATLRSRWLETLRGQAASKAIAMCGSGVTACHNLLALEIAGLPGARLYAGSWSEWIRDATRPIEPQGPGLRSSDRQGS